MREVEETGEDGTLGGSELCRGEKEWIRISLRQDQILSSKTRRKMGTDRDEFTDTTEVEAIILFLWMKQKFRLFLRVKGSGSWKVRWFN